MVVHIYKITNLINGKLYVGQTQRSVEERFKEHCSRGKYPIGKAIKKYGKKNFKIEILAECSSVEEANPIEIYWIKTSNCKVPNGYNLTDGGKGHKGCKHSEENKKIISIKNIGCKHTKETRLAMSIGQKERYEDPLAHKKLSDGQKRRYSNPLEHEKKSIEQKKRYENPDERKKISLANKKRYENP